MANPIEPRIAALSYLHTAGATRQSAARRFWINRFRTGGPRVPMRRIHHGQGHASGFENLMAQAPESSSPIAPIRSANPEPHLDGGVGNNQTNQEAGEY